MKWLVSILKRFKWAAWAILGILVLVVLWVLRTLFTADPKAPARLPEVPEALKKKVAKAEEDALIARVEAKAKAEHAKEILDEAAAIEDGKERRRRLAEALRRL